MRISENESDSESGSEYESESDWFEAVISEEDFREQLAELTLRRLKDPLSPMPGLTADGNGVSSANLSYQLNIDQAPIERMLKKKKARGDMDL